MFSDYITFCCRQTSFTQKGSLWFDVSNSSTFHYNNKLIHQRCANIWRRPFVFFYHYQINLKQLWLPSQMFDLHNYLMQVNTVVAHPSIYNFQEFRVPRGDEWNIEKHFTGDVTFLHFIWLVLYNKFDSETTLRQALFPIALYLSLTHRHTHWMWILEFEFPNAKKKVHICVCIHMHIVILVAPETEQISFLKNTQKIYYFLKSLFAYSSLSLYPFLVDIFQKSLLTANLI